MFKKLGFLLAIVCVGLISQADLPSRQSDTGLSESEEAKEYDKGIERNYFQRSGNSVEFAQEAIQAFSSECGQHYYNLDQLLRYYVQTPSSSYVSQIRNQENLCIQDTLREDQDLETALNAALSQGGLTLAGLQAVFMGIPDDFPLVPEAENLHSFLENFALYQRLCRDGLCGGETLRARQGKNYPLDTSCFSNSYKGHFISGLKLLSANDCKERRQNLQSFVTQSEILDHLAGLPRSCQNPSGSCVGELRVLAGLDQNPQVPDLFKICASHIDVARNCCGNPESCGENNPIRQLRASLHSSGANAQCQSGSLHNIKAQAQDKMQDVCIKVTDQCEDYCRNNLTVFKEKLLACFVMPDFQAKSFAHHSQNHCHQQIRDIINSYNNKAGDNYAAYHLTLDLDENAQTKACNKPFEELKRDLEARSQDLAKNLCETQTAEAPMQDMSSQAHLSLRGGSSSSRRRPVEFDLGDPHEEPEMTTVPGISHPVMTKRYYLDNVMAGSIIRLSEEDLGYKEGFEWPMPKSSIERRERLEANIGRPGYNQWGYKIDPELEICGGPICSMTSVYIPGYESPNEKPSSNNTAETEFMTEEGKLLSGSQGALYAHQFMEREPEREELSLMERIRSVFFDIEPANRPPQLDLKKMTEEGRRKAHREFLRDLPPAMHWRDAIRYIIEVERDMLTRSCEMHGCERPPETREEREERLKRQRYQENLRMLRGL